MKKSPFNASSNCYSLIKKYEGFSSELYFCPANLLTIGYGHVVLPGEKFTKLTEEEATKLLIEDCKKFEKIVNNSVKVEINQNMFDALVSFTFNVGPGNKERKGFTNSTLLTLLNEKKYFGAAEQFNKWVRGGGKVLPGLIKRRKEEMELFLKDF